MQKQKDLKYLADSYIVNSDFNIRLVVELNLKQNTVKEAYVLT